MEKKFLPSASGKELVEALEANADKIENFSYTKAFTPDQLLVFKDELSTTMIEYNVLEDELNAIKDSFKQKMKPLKDETKLLLTNIRNKAEFVSEKCFIVMEGNQVGYYNSEGNLVYERPILPGETQKTVFSVVREAANDK